MTAKAQSAHEEMAYELAENKYQDGDYPVSIPCQLRFTTTPEQDTERFHQAIANRGWSKLTHEPDKYHEEGKPNWQGEICQSSSPFKRLQLIVFRQDLVRIFPYEDEPTVEELGEVISAIEDGFNAELEHEPISRETNKSERGST